MAEGSKVILLGDPDQVDSMFLDASSNGLVHTAQLTKRHRITAHLELSTGVRSELADLAADLLWVCCRICLLLNKIKLLSDCLLEQGFAMQLITPEIRTQIDDMTRRAGHMGIFDGDKKLLQITELESQMADAGFWDNPEAARKVIGEVNRLKSAVNSAKAFNGEVEDLQAMLELVEESGDDTEVAAMEQEVIDALERLRNWTARGWLPLSTGPHDGCNALLTVNAGAGGTESCDWANMLLRMYTRWAERAGFAVEIQDIMPGEEARFLPLPFALRGQMPTAMPRRSAVCTVWFESVLLTRMPVAIRHFLQSM